jgi:hypothetical protein
MEEEKWEEKEDVGGTEGGGNVKGNKKEMRVMEEEEKVE